MDQFKKVQTSAIRLLDELDKSDVNHLASCYPGLCHFFQGFPFYKLHNQSHHDYITQLQVEARFLGISESSSSIPNDNEHGFKNEMPNDSPMISHGHEVSATNISKFLTPRQSFDEMM